MRLKKIYQLKKHIKNDPNQSVKPMTWVMLPRPRKPHRKKIIKKQPDLTQINLPNL
jgi:hypothetical protein